MSDFLAGKRQEAEAMQAAGLLPRFGLRGSTPTAATTQANDYASTYATNSAPGNVQAAQQLASLTGPYNGSEANTLADSYKQATQYLGPFQPALVGSTAQNSASQTQGTDSMETMSQGFGGMPTMIQQFYNPKSSRGSRLGRGPAMASTMVQYGSAGGGPNITVSPTFSDIGNPFVSAGGGNIEVGDIALGGPIRQTPAGGGGTTPTRPGGGGGGRTGGGGGGRTGGGGGGGGNTLDIKRELRQAEKTGQSKNPRITKSELKDIFKSGDVGPRGLRNLVEDSGLKLGGKAQDFLNRQLDKVGAGGGRTGGGSGGRTGGGGGGGGGNRRQPQGVPGLINKAGVPGTTNLKGTIPTGGSNQSIVQRAATQGGRDDKLGKGEVKDLLKTGDISPKKILNQIQKGNIEASKKAIAKAKAATKSSKKK